MKKLVTLALLARFAASISPNFRTQRPLEYRGLAHPFIADMQAFKLPVFTSRIAAQLQEQHHASTIVV